MAVDAITAAAPVEAMLSQKHHPSTPDAFMPAASDHDGMGADDSAPSRPAPTAHTDAEAAAVDILAVATGLRSQAEVINVARRLLAPESIQSFRHADDDASTRKHIQDIRDEISRSEQLLAAWNDHVMADYGAVGALPSKGDDETWTQGSFSLSRRGPGFEVRAESDGTVLISESGGPFTAWSPKGLVPQAEDASAVLRTLKVVDRVV